MPGKNTNKTDKRNKVNKSNKNQIVLIFKDLCILWWTQSRTGLYYQNLFSDLFMYLKLSAVPRRILLYVEHKVNFMENFAKIIHFTAREAINHYFLNTYFSTMKLECSEKI